MGDETGIEGIVSRGQPRERGVEGGGIWRVRGDWVAVGFRDGGKKREHRSDFVGWRPYLPPRGKGSLRGAAGGMVHKRQMRIYLRRANGSPLYTLG